MDKLTLSKKQTGAAPQKRYFTKKSLMLVLAIISTFALAQDNSATENAPQQDEPIERIEVQGVAGDAALQAFNSGNFELAAIEFKKNAKCALRVERNLRASINSFQNAQINQSLQNTASNVNTTSGSVSNSAGDSVPTRGRMTKNDSKDKQKVRPRTCENRGFQMYMLGLSQIQLGQPEEAEKNFKTATFLNRNLYDAHYRLALMQFLREDRDGGFEQFEEIQDILERCRDCEAKEEIITRVDFLQKILDGEVKLR